MKTQKTFTINFIPGKKLSFVFIFLGIIFLLPFSLGSESLEVRTYYPLPYGSYHNVVASDYMQIGGTDMVNRTRIGNMSDGFRGIETIENDAYLIADNNIEIDTTTADMMIDIANEDSEGKLMGLCRWISWSFGDTQCSNLSGGVQRWQPIMLGRRISPNNFETYYNTQAEHAGGGGHHYVLHNRVLCCRIER
jgi:hypothetical protein